MTRRGALLVFSGPSGSGKSTVCGHLLKTFPGLSFSVSATTRPIRGHERDGVDYHYLTREAFRERVEAGAFVEWAEVHGNQYGTLKSTLEASLAAGRDLLLDIDVQGGLNLKRHFPAATLVFLMPPSVEVLRARLSGRGTDDAAVVERRVENALAEMERAESYDHIVVNDRLEETLRRVTELVEGLLNRP